MAIHLQNWRWWGLIALLAGTQWAAGDDRSQRVLVVYNTNEPASQPLATYYAEQRGIPTNRLCGLAVRNAEVITRREFNQQIREPLRQFLADHHLLFQIAGATFDNRLDFIALSYGIPLRIAEDPTLKESLPDGLPSKRNEAAVDSELTTLPAPDQHVGGWLPNPFFNAVVPHFEPPLNNTLVLVTRLDGPDPDTVRRLIDDAIATERYGLLGRCYFDARHTTDPGYIDGDRWIQAADRLFRSAGYDCELENTADLFPEDYPLTDAAVYAGWYASNVVGPFRRADFKFRRGAVAYHLHSSSATSVRTRTANWVGPLLAKGATAAFGNVREPYLQTTPHLDIFFRNLLAGATFAEAGWASQPVLSWQTTFVGDPLYRPFAVSVDEQITRLTRDHQPDLEWAYIRKINLLVANGDASAAEQLCRTQAAALQSAPLYEKLGDIAPSGERAAAYRRALELAGDLYRAKRITQKLEALLKTQ